MQSETQPAATTAKTTLIERLNSLYEYDREPVLEKKLHGY